MRERKRTRLKGFDYATPGAYFVTICVKNRDCVFGYIENGIMQLTIHGQIVQYQWEWLHEHYKYLKMDAFTVMPNHFHAILQIEDVDETVGTVDNSRDCSLRRIKPVPELIGAFKTTSSKLIHQSGLHEFQW